MKQNAAFVFTGEAISSNPPYLNFKFIRPNAARYRMPPHFAAAAIFFFYSSRCCCLGVRRFQIIRIYFTWWMPPFIRALEIISLQRLIINERTRVLNMPYFSTWITAFEQHIIYRRLLGWIRVITASLSSCTATMPIVASATWWAKYLPDISGRVDYGPPDSRSILLSGRWMPSQAHDLFQFKTRLLRLSHYW